MNISTSLSVWVAAFITLGLLSFFWKDNPVYRLAENLFMGASLAHYVTLSWGTIRDMGLGPLGQGRIIAIVPLVLGLLVYTRFYKPASWMSRIPIGLLVGIGTGMVVRGTIGSDIVGQMRATMLNPTNLDNLLILVGVVTTLTYFFFTWRQKGVLQSSARVGRLVMMVMFGAIFGNAVMGRMTLLIGRLQFLWGDWLGIAKM
jgi:hypothetical protein